MWRVMRTPALDEKLRRIGTYESPGIQEYTRDTKARGLEEDREAAPGGSQDK